MGLPFITSRYLRGGQFAAAPAAPAADTGVTRQSDLVLWYKMDEGTGTAVADSSGSGFDAAFTGDGATWVTGRDGVRSALAFDGVDDAIVDGASNYDVATAMNGHMTDNTLQGAFSVSFWTIQPTGGNVGTAHIGSYFKDGNPFMIIRSDYSGANTRGSLGMLPGPGLLYYIKTDYWEADTEWHHVVYTFNGLADGAGGEWNAYRNGSLNTTLTGTGGVGWRRPMQNYAEHLWIGDTWSADAGPHSVEDFRIYDVELGADDVTAIYAGGDGDY